MQPRAAQISRGILMYRTPVTEPAAHPVARPTIASRMLSSAGTALRHAARPAPELGRAVAALHLPPSARI